MNFKYRHGVSTKVAWGFLLYSFVPLLGRVLCTSRGPNYLKVSSTGFHIETRSQLVMAKQEKKLHCASKVARNQKVHLLSLNHHSPVMKGSLATLNWE